MGTNDTKSHVHEDEIRLMHLVAMFQLAAMQQLGKLVNPMTNEVERDLPQARASIDMIETIKRKTEGNRSSAETEFLDKVLFELHMNYVDEANDSGVAGGEKGENDTPDGAGEPQTAGEEAQATDAESDKTSDPDE